jgi:hypothetical protein
VEAASVAVTFHITQRINQTTNITTMVEALHSHLPTGRVAGFIVERVDIATDPCVFDPCDKNAACTRNGINTFSCECNDGLWGTGFTCQAWSFCVENYTYIKRQPSSESDRLCLPVTACEFGQYEAATATLTSDRQCALCGSGEEATWVNPPALTLTNPCDQPPTVGFCGCRDTKTGEVGGWCDGTRPCGAGAICEPWVQTTELQPLSIEYACAACQAGRYDHDNVSTTACAQCDEGYVVAADRSSCTANETYYACHEYERLQCSPQAACTRAANGSFSCHCIDGLWGNGHWCAPPMVCTQGLTFETLAPTHSSNRECSAVKSCPNFVGLYVAKEPTLKNDTVCGTCLAGSEFEDKGCRSCIASYYDDDADPRTVCVECAGGDVGAERTTCMTAGCPSHIRCAPQATCVQQGDSNSSNYACVCGRGFWGGGESCYPWKTCLEGVTYASIMPTSTADIVCKAATECSPHEFESVTVTAISDRVCVPCASGREQLLLEEACIRVVNAVWQGLLPDNDFQPESNFFTAGGSQFMAMQMLTKVRQELDRLAAFGYAASLSLIPFLEAPTFGTVVQLALLAVGRPAIDIVCEACKADTFYDHDHVSSTPCQLCRPGYVVLESLQCILDDPCEADEHRCSKMALCLRFNRSSVSNCTTCDMVPLPRGQYLCECGVGFWGDGYECTPWTQCAVGLEFEIRAPNPNSDRMCAPVSVCEAGTSEKMSASCVATTEEIYPNPRCSRLFCKDLMWAPAVTNSSFCVGSAVASRNCASAKFPDALKACLDVGARLCTSEEAHHVIKMDPECNFDEGLWTSSSMTCGLSYAKILLNGGRELCIPKEQNAGLRCCSDVNAAVCGDSTASESVWGATGTSEDAAVRCEYPDGVAVDRLCMACPAGTYTRHTYGEAGCYPCPTGAHALMDKPPPPSPPLPPAPLYLGVS